MNSELDKDALIFNIIWERICKLTGWKNFGQLASYLGITSASISGAKKRGFISLEWVFKVAQGYNVSTDWLVTGRGSMIKGEEPGGDESGVVDEPGMEYIRRADDRYSYIPLYNIKASAGGGAVVDYELVVDSLAFKTTWIRQQLNVSPKDLYLIHVEGESMEPTLRPGDVILVDHRAAQTLPRDGIYVLRMDSTLMVKRLQRLPGGTIEVTSDNPAYKPFSINMAKPMDDLAIIGRVVWCGRRM